MRGFALLVVLWISASICSSVREDDPLFSNNRGMDVNQNIPALFKRIYKEWSEETSCVSESLKSSQAEVKLKGHLRFAMKARIAARSPKPVMKVELWLEFYEVPQEGQLPNHIYVADIRPMDSRIEPSIQPSTYPYISEEGLVELSFNVTGIYLNSKNFGKKHVSFRINIRHNGDRNVKGLKEATEVKAFLIIYEFEDDACNDYSSVNRNRARRSPEFSHTLPRKPSAKSLVRSYHRDSDNAKGSCGLREWYVSFDNIGWDQWVIEPTGVMAYACSGACSFPLGSQINSTAHAHLQSFVYYFKGEKWPACCVPSVLEPLTMILYDIEDSMIFVAKYPNMIAKTCACL